ncbi:MAG: DNA primase [Verrucomicrobiota bacterium]
MPAIKQSSIRDLKDRINIYDVVSREVTLKRAGKDYKGLSPFTTEKTPSFFISPDKGFYKCFSTGNAGDIISFVMETERLNFVEAVETLAQRFSFELEYEENGRPREDRSLRQELFEIHEIVAEYWHEVLLSDTPDGEWIRDYWVQQRKFDLEVAKDFKIGFAPPSGLALGQRIEKRRFRKEALEACGLFYCRRGTTAAAMGYRFRGRLMIPIRDHQGRITAFTARQLEVTPENDPSREAKYVNSPETPIFNKSKLLFNLDRARMEVGENEPFVMVEGQLDAIRCWSVGLKGAVAPQGTGITEQQLRLIKRYEPRVLVLLDGDNAGQKAALRMLPLALAQAVEIEFLPLDEGTDPDDLFRDGGKEALDPLIERSVDAISFACKSLAPDPSSLTPQAKAKVANELYSIIEKCESGSVRAEYLRQVAFLLRLDSTAVDQDFARFQKGKTARLNQTPPQKKEEPKDPNTGNSVEYDLLMLCVSVPEVGTQIAHIVDDSWIDTATKEGKLLNHVLNEFLHDMWNGPESLNDQLEDAELKILAADILFKTPDYENPMRLANEALKKMATKYADARLKFLKLEIARKQANLNDEVLSLLEESSTLQKIKATPPQIGSTHH